MSWLRRRLWEPLRAQLRQGLSPERMAWSLALGLGAGVSPLVGSSTGLCILLALVFRLNQVVMQAANSLAYPLQLPGCPSRWRCSVAPSAPMPGAPCTPSGPPSGMPAWPGS